MTPADDTPAFPALPQEMSIYTAAETRDRWLQWWHAHGRHVGPTLAVDAAAVDTVDGAGVQLLVALWQLLRRHDLALALQAPSDTLVASCQALGATRLLDTAAQP